MGVLVRLPNIWWTCSCEVADSLGNEWTEYCEVLASTKDEAYDIAEDVCKRRGLGMYSAQIMARPEKKVEPGSERPAPVLSLPPPPPPTPITPSTPVTPWRGAEEPDFVTQFFTKYADKPRVIYNAEDV